MGGHFRACSTADTWCRLRAYGFTLRRDVTRDSAPATKRYRITTAAPRGRQVHSRAISHAWHLQLIQCQVGPVWSPPARVSRLCPLVGAGHRAQLSIRCRPRGERGSRVLISGISLKLYEFAPQPKAAAHRTVTTRSSRSLECQRHHHRGRRTGAVRTPTKQTTW